MKCVHLQVVSDEVVERVDAARNRALLLNSAAALIAERGVDCVSIDAVAAKAGVGKGTVFRRFGSRSGLMHALLNRFEEELQEGFLFGPAPLGPGAPPSERIVAFGVARLEFIRDHGDILREAESSVGTRYASSYSVYVMHVAMLLRQAQVHGDYRLLADSLLASLDASLVLYQKRDLQIPLIRIVENWRTFVLHLTSE
ncbi:TetR/AcrR family transcriptional regulator [Rhodococcoides yunnanense]|uniref:Helix-turn-helix domain-containing protein n=1 Tax=Rhodococcoides yunnanense TaxID=278209 RepID=A0ABU4BIB4_9NOCA|nr:helix-turn-helix domain-containing protein [Rhodococcus yunnanensis]MDV6263950.1 helix-turn-helix domain-containing protein [Rhodococcus yunnanensis]